MNLTRPLHDITPLELINGRWYKRDDALAFDNGVSGKVRTSIFLAEYAKESGANTLVYGGSVHAPALGRVASAARYTGMGCTLIIGSHLKTAIKHPTVEVAFEAGAHFGKAPISYNPALQRCAAQVVKDAEGLCWQVPYGVSTPDDWTEEQVWEFLEQDADQVQGLENMKTLVIPFGSGNATAGILYGLAKHNIDHLAIKLIGVGPDRMDWLRHRFGPNGLDTDDINIEHLSLHGWFAEYSDRMPEHEDGIDFHPVYEGKVVRYLNQLKPEWWTRRDGTTCMWIVGGPLP